MFLWVTYPCKARTLRLVWIDSNKAPPRANASYIKFEKVQLNYGTVSVQKQKRALMADRLLRARTPPRANEPYRGTSLKRNTIGPYV